MLDGEMKMKAKIYFVVLILVSVIIGCTKKTPATVVEDNLYIVDTCQILLLCEAGTADTEYIELLAKLKGNAREVKAVVESLNELGDSVEIKNAVGVAYTRLREYAKAQDILETALTETQAEEQQACILTNLAAINSLTGFHEEAYDLLVLAEQKKIDNPIKQLVLESNLRRANLDQSNSIVRDITEVKKLLEKERQLLGSNQFIGIYNYTTLGHACFKDDQYKKSKEYMNRAIELNDALYQYKFVAAELYRILAEINMNYKDDVKKAFECINNAIELLENWEEKDHPDLIQLYLSRGRMYYAIYQEKEAMKDFETALDRCKPMHELAANSYLNIGWLDYEKRRDVLAAENLMKAYYIWDELGITEFKDLIRETLERIYYRSEKSDVISFEAWFQELLKEVKQGFLQE